MFNLNVQEYCGKHDSFGDRRLKKKLISWKMY